MGQIWPGSIFSTPNLNKFLIVHSICIQIHHLGRIKTMFLTTYLITCSPKTYNKTGSCLYYTSFPSIFFPTTPPPLFLLSIWQFLLIFQHLAQSSTFLESVHHPSLPKLVTDSSSPSLYLAWASLDLKVSQIEITKFVYMVVSITRQGVFIKSRIISSTSISFHFWYMVSTQ